MKKISIAIDGPSAAGKSTIAKIVAKKLDYVYIDTGAMYRCVGYYCLENNVDLHDENAVTQALDNIKIEMNSANQVFLNQEDVSAKIRHDRISMAASVVSTYQEVRNFLVLQQRQMASQGGVILDGRDIGTVVLPYADYKFFVTASEEVRAKRRFDQIKDKQNVSYEQILKDLQIRDYNDTHRKVAPLIPAKDSIILDTSDFTLDQTVDMCVDIITKNKAK